jgi:methionyl-tRNA formyltransferase
MAEFRALEEPILPTKKLSVIVVGCTPLARKVISSIESIVDLKGVINLTQEAGKKKSLYDHLTEFTNKNPDKVFLTDDINSPATQGWIRSLLPEVIVQCGWSQIFTKDTLKLPTLFSIGIHPAPLPVGRGAAIINWKIIEGGGPWGNSLFVMESKTDTGDILDFEPFRIEDDDDIVIAYKKVDESAVTMLLRTLPMIADDIFTRTVQDEEKATRYFKRTKKDGLMDFFWSATKILRYIRALTRPYPGAFFNIKGNTFRGELFCWSAKDGGDSDGNPPGTIIEVTTDRGIKIAVGSRTSVWLTEVTPPNEESISAYEWAKQRRIGAGYKFI